MIRDVYDLRKDVDELKYSYNNIKSTAYYIQTSSDTVVPVFDKNTWSTTKPTPVKDKFIWFCNLINLTVGEINTNPVCLGSGFETNSIVDVDVEYARGKSIKVAPTTGWSSTYSQAQGYFVWTRDKLTYKNGDVEYTNPSCIDNNSGYNPYVKNGTWWVGEVNTGVSSSQNISNVVINPDVRSGDLVECILTFNSGTKSVFVPPIKSIVRITEMYINTTSGVNAPILPLSKPTNLTNPKEWCLNYIPPSEDKNNEGYYYTWTSSWIEYDDVVSNGASVPVCSNPAGKIITDSLTEDSYVAKGLSEEGSEVFIKKDITEHILNSTTTSSKIKTGSIILRRQGDIVSVMFNGIVEFTTTGTIATGLTEYAPDIDLYFRDASYNGTLVLKNNGNLEVSLGSDKKMIGSYTYIVNDKIATKINFTKTSYYYGDSVTGQLVEESSGTAIAGSQLYISINGKTYSVTTDNNGYGSLPTNLSPGNYTVYMSSDTTTTYSAATTVVKNIAINRVSYAKLNNKDSSVGAIVYGGTLSIASSNGYIYLKLLTNEDKPLIFITVTAKFGDVELSVMSNNTGRLAIPVGSNKGLWNVIIPDSTDTHIDAKGSFNVVVT